MFSAAASLWASTDVEAQQPKAVQPQAAQHLTGRVTTDSGAAVYGAEVIVTRGPDRAVLRDTTDGTGRFSIRWDVGTGDYLVYVAAVGRAPFRKRVQSMDPFITVDVILSPAPVARLAAVSVVGDRPRPRRESDPSSTPGSLEHSADGRPGDVSPDLAGDLTALASALPGVHAVGDGISVLGLSPEQNETTLDGLAFPASDVPREARLVKRVVTSTFDATRGGFSGASVDLNFWGGGLFSDRTGSLTIDAPQLQFADATGRVLGHTYTNLRASAGASGPFGRTDAWRYNTAVQASHRRSAAVSLFTAPVDALRAAGVPPDSAATFKRLLADLGVPVGVGSDDGTETGDRAAFLARIDRTGFDWDARRTRPRSGAVTLYAQLRRADHRATGPVSVSTLGRRTSGQTVAMQGLYSAFFGEHQDRLTEFRSGVSVNRNASAPLVGLPVASVLVGGIGTEVETEPEPRALATLRFGGSAFSGSRRTRWTWDARNETQWFWTPRHRLKLAAESRLEGLSSRELASPRGTYAYASLADLEAGRPASFSITSRAAAPTSGTWNGALALADFWRVSPKVELVYGVRLEANRFTASPRFDADVAQRLGVSTNAAPGRVHASPRLGFTWVYGTRPRPAPGTGFGGLTIARPPAQLRGGIGEFRSAFTPGHLIGPLTSSVGVTETHCVGDAVPIPDWQAFAGGAVSPTACATDSGAGATQGRSARAVSTLAPDFDVPASWRAALAWSSRWKRLAVAVEGVASWNRHLPGTLDENLRATPAARLASEGGRVLYVPTSAFVPTTGAVAATLARRDSTLGSVLSRRSDLRSTSQQVTVSLAPELGTATALALSWTLSDVRAEHFGFDGAAFGDIRQVEGSRGDFSARHHLVFRASHTFARLRNTRFSIVGSVRSAMPYTPVVSGDLNGDGRVNDRAFIISPETARAAGDTALAAATSALLASAPARAQRCLSEAAGRPVARNACEGPWSVMTNARIDLPWRFLRLGVGERRRGGIALHLTNPLGGLDQLIHGSNRLRGWGAPAMPNPVLYAVSGFDPATERFRYRVNPRFGSVDPRHSVWRAPFRITVDVTLNLGRPLEVQQVDRFLAVGRTRPGTKLDSAAIRLRYERNVPNVYRGVLVNSDSLFLTIEQVEQLEEAQRAYLATLDSLWGRMAGEFARLPDAFDAGVALERQEAYIDGAWEVNRAAAFRIQEVLTPVQFALAGSMVNYLVSVTGRTATRVFHDY